MSTMKLKEKLASTYSRSYICETYHVDVEDAYLAGFEKALQLACEKSEDCFCFEAIADIDKEEVSDDKE